MPLLETAPRNIQSKNLTLIDTLHLVAERGLNACYIPYSLTKDGGFISAAYSDIVFISIDYYSKNRFDLLRKHLELIKSKKAVFVGISTFYNQDIFKECVEIGVDKFLFKPITEEVLLSELDEDFQRLESEDKFLKRKSLLKLKKEEIELSKVRLDQIFSNSIVYNEALKVLNADLFFRKRINQHIYFTVGEGQESNLNNSLISADAVGNLDRHISIENWYNDTIFDTIDRVLPMPFEFIELDGKKMEVRYKGASNALFVRKCRVMDLPQSTPISVRYDDVFFLFSDGFEKQRGHLEHEFGREDLNKFLVFLSRLSMKEMKKEIAIFLENWKNSRSQTDDITLLAFKI